MFLDHRVFIPGSILWPFLPFLVQRPLVSDWEGWPIYSVCPFKGALDMVSCDFSPDTLFMLTLYLFYSH